MGQDRPGVRPVADGGAATVRSPKRFLGAAPSPGAPAAIAAAADWSGDRGGRDARNQQPTRPAVPAVDDAMTRALLRTALAGERAVRVAAVAEGEEGLLRAREPRPALVLADLLMAGKAGATSAGCSASTRPRPPRRS
jgi:hypothetical protein